MSHEQSVPHLDYWKSHKNSVCAGGRVSECEWFRAYLKACTDSFIVLACIHVCSTRHDYGIRARDILYFLSPSHPSFPICYVFLFVLHFLIQLLTSKTCQSKVGLSCGSLRNKARKQDADIRSEAKTKALYQRDTMCNHCNCKASEFILDLGRSILIEKHELKVCIFLKHGLHQPSLVVIEICWHVVYIFQP